MVARSRKNLFHLSLVSQLLQRIIFAYFTTFRTCKRHYALALAVYVITAWLETKRIFHRFPALRPTP